MSFSFKDEQFRAYLYRVAAVVLVVLVAYGVISEDQSDVWLQVIAAVFAIGSPVLASANTSTKGE